jgi:hypothetical protein
MNLAIGNSLQDVVLAQANPSENSVGPDTLGQASRNAEIYTFKDKTHVYTKPALLDFVKNFPAILLSLQKRLFKRKICLQWGH